MLFLIHYNDVHRSLKHTKIVTYADDTVIFTSSSEVSVIESNLNHDINTLASWLRRNELIINLKKGKPKLCYLALQEDWENSKRGSSTSK